MLLSLFHRTRGSTALLDWRIRVFFVGAVLGLVGIFLNISWLVSAALIVLLGGVALRRWAAPDSESEEQEPTRHE